MEAIELYQSENGFELQVFTDSETVWLTQAQIVKLFGRDQSVVSRHIKNAIDEGEVDRTCNMQILHIASSDRPVTFYDLDVIISVGYRIKSKEGVHFRRWATRVLHGHLAAVTLMIALSRPEEKDIMCLLVMNFLQRNSN